MDGEKHTSILFKATDPIGTDVVLPVKTWDHIKKRHPEIKKVNKIKETIQKPDFVILNDIRNTTTYTTTSSLRLFFNVHATMHEDGNYVATAYLTKDIPEGDCIWQRQKK
jgi:hypothetical protein